MIQFKDVSKTFKSKGVTTQALQHVSLTIDDGDMFGVIGFSGAGKSTLLRMVNGLEMPTEGHVEINGQDLSKISHNEMRKLRKSIGMVFQQFNLLDSRTVFDNVAIPLRLNKADKDKVMELLEYVNLADKADAYPGQLSGGQKQRVGIARALATNPSILLCDEATSALDPETTESILQLLERIHKELNITMLIVTHEIQVIQRLCNRVAVMEHGKVVERGSVLEVFSNPQQDMTKKFVRTVIPDQIPPSVVAKIHEEKDNYKILKLRFLGDNATDHLMYHINKTFSVQTNILFASVNELQKTILGIFILQIIGNDAEIAKVIQYIDEQQVQWQEVDLGVPMSQIILAAEQTVYMVFVSLFLGTILAIIMSVVLVLTNDDGILKNKYVYTVLNTVINIIRSIPFIILMVFILPLTKMIVGTRIGTTAALVPLVIFIAPYLTRLFENSILEVSKGIVEAAQSMGASYFEIVWYFLLPEAKSSLILSITTGTIGLIGATAMAGVIGAGGVGDLALTYGYERLNTPLMFFTVVILVIFVQIIQSIGNHFAYKTRNH
jgi:D-methionine transport system ATP-binding protein